MRNKGVGYKECDFNYMTEETEQAEGKWLKNSERQQTQTIVYKRGNKGKVTY